MQKKQQSIVYINPRLAILRIDVLNRQKLIQAECSLKARHKNYFHIFNLSSCQFNQSNLGAIGYTNFKWRQIPFSLSETIKILTSMDYYQIVNKANTAVLAVSDRDSYDFCVFICQIYTHLLGLNELRMCKRQYAMNQFFKLYKTVDIKNPPLKIIDAVSFKIPQVTFIPVLKIFNQSRHNSFEQVYTHYPQNQLTKYYIDRKSPLAQGIGLKYCQKKPQTKYLSKPVTVYGDVKIQVYSFNTLKLQKQFVVGFNTKALQYDQTIVKLQKYDFYSVKNDQTLGNDQGLIIQVSNFCDICNDQAKCLQCTQIIKKLGNTYSQTQGELQKLSRKRSRQQSLKLFS